MEDKNYIFEGTFKFQEKTVDVKTNGQMQGVLLAIIDLHQLIIKNYDDGKDKKFFEDIRNVIYFLEENSLETLMSDDEYSHSLDYEMRIEVIKTENLSYSINHVYPTFDDEVNMIDLFVIIKLLLENYKESTKVKDLSLIAESLYDFEKTIKVK